jgi:hypothetical protein
MSDLGARAKGRTKSAHVWERAAADFYVEPPEAVEALLAVERFPGGVWDPAGEKRAEWFARMPLARVWVFPWRLNMPPGDYTGPRKGGTIAFAWFVFEPGYRGRPQIDWLRKPAKVAA